MYEEFLQKITSGFIYEIVFQGIYVFHSIHSLLLVQRNGTWWNFKSLNFSNL